jgi:Leucine-rich repeat (LRR) protein
VAQAAKMWCVCEAKGAKKKTIRAVRRPVSRGPCERLCMGANPAKPIKDKDAKLAQQLYDIDPSSTRLDLKNKNIRELPEEIRVLKLLNWLNLPNNSLESLPASIGELSNLKTLRLLSNKLSTLPPTVANLSNLSVLDISKNQFRLISPCIGSLVSLTELNLQQNLLESVCVSFSMHLS